MILFLCVKSVCRYLLISAPSPQRGVPRQPSFEESTKFKNVWTTHSKSPIAYERGRIYFDNYRCCVSSVASEPRKLYEMPKCSKSEKIEDALLWECPVGDILPDPSDYKSSLIALTAHNWLLRISATTGEVLEKIYLASYCKFRYLSWDTPQEVIAVKSAQNKGSAAARQAGTSPPVLLYLAVFRVLPFSLVGILEINKKVFENVTDATLSHGILIVMYSSGLVRLYSFQAIIEQTHHLHSLKFHLWRTHSRLEAILGTTSSRLIRRNRKEFFIFVP